MLDCKRTKVEIRRPILNGEKSGSRWSLKLVVDIKFFFTFDYPPLIFYSAHFCLINIYVYEKSTDFTIVSVIAVIIMV